MKRKILILLSALILIFIGLKTYAEVSNQTITACIRKDGLLRFTTSSCDPKETLIAWNIQGPKGDKGDQGIQGPKGDIGTPGSPSWDENRIKSLEARILALENTPTPIPVSFNSIITDDFNSYNNGNIVGQNGWRDRVNGEAFIIQSTLTKEGAKAINNSYSEGDSIIYKLGNNLNDGKQSFYIRPASASYWSAYSDGNAQIRISKNSWDSLSFIALTLKKDGHVAFYNPSIGTYQNFSTYNNNQWNLIEIEWRSIDNKAHYRINGENWTDWMLFEGSASFTGFNSVGFDFNNSFGGGSGGIYIDSLF